MNQLVISAQENIDLPNIDLLENPYFWAGLYTVLESMEEQNRLSLSLSEMADLFASGNTSQFQISKEQAERLQLEIFFVGNDLSEDKNLTALLLGSDLEDPLRGAYAIPRFRNKDFDFRYNPGLLRVESRPRDSDEPWLNAGIQMVGIHKEYGGIYVNRESQHSLFAQPLYEIASRLGMVLDGSFYWRTDTLRILDLVSSNPLAELLAAGKVTRRISHVVREPGSSKDVPFSNHLVRETIDNYRNRGETHNRPL